MRLKRTGWTLHEMMISLSVMAVAAALAAHSAVVHLRFYRGAGEIIATRSQVGAVGAIVQATLWGVSPDAGDIVFASDSALEIRASVGAAVSCENGIGLIVVPAPMEHGNSLAGFEPALESGDVADIFTADSLGEGWIRATVASMEPHSGCARFPSTGSMAIALVEPLAVSAGAFVRFSRPVRLNHYRASDGLWYFGVRDWNSATLKLNTVQPVAGPLEPHRSDAASGLTFHYFDGSGTELGSPAEPSRVAAVRVVVKSKARRPVNVAGLVRPGFAWSDSLSATIAFRNAR